MAFAFRSLRIFGECRSTFPRVGVQISVEIADVLSNAVQSWPNWANLGRCQPISRAFDQVWRDSDRLGAISANLRARSSNFEGISAEFERCWPDLVRFRLIWGELEQCSFDFDQLRPCLA